MFPRGVSSNGTRSPPQGDCKLKVTTDRRRSIVTVRIRLGKLEVHLLPDGDVKIAG